MANGMRVVWCALVGATAATVNVPILHFPPSERSGSTCITPLPHAPHAGHFFHTLCVCVVFWGVKQPTSPHQHCFLSAHPLASACARERRPLNTQ
jgi:hypothetical protein